MSGGRPPLHRHDLSLDPRVGEELKATLQIGLRDNALSGDGMNDDSVRPASASPQRCPSADFS
jgi:hypothetical protein